MIIRGASLVNRFYPSDGWTKEAVVALLNIQDAKYVETRYWNEKSCGVPETEDEPVMYYAVYDVFHRGVWFVEDRLKEHEYDPFSWGCIDPGEKLFKSKNRVGPDPGKAKDGNVRRTTSRRRVRRPKGTGRPPAQVE